jgi:hypothetical protein
LFEHDLRGERLAFVPGKSGIRFFRIMLQGCVLRMSRERGLTAFAAGALLLSSLSLCGCATSTTGSSPMDARAEAPRKASLYPAVGDMPPERAAPEMTADERSKLKKELIAARDRQASVAKNQTEQP